MFRMRPDGTVVVPLDMFKYPSFLRLGVVGTVDYEKGICNVNMVDAFAVKNVIPVNLPYAGRGWGIYPGIEEGSRVIVGVGFEEQAYIVGYLPNPGYLNQDLTVEPISKLVDAEKEFPYRIPEAGEIYIQSKKNADIFMDNKGEVNIRSSSGKLDMGVAKNSNDEIVLLGNRARSQVKLIVVQSAETRSTAEGDTVVRQAATDADLTSRKVAEITIGTKMDGNVVATDGDGSEIQCEIAMASGAKIQINAAGKIKVFNGTEPKLIDKPVLKAARNGDEILIPIGMGYFDSEHPDLTQIATENQAAIAKLSMQLLYISPLGTPTPLIYAPGAHIVLKGNIVEGSESVLVGD